MLLQDYFNALNDEYDDLDDRDKEFVNVLPKLITEANRYRDRMPHEDWLNLQQDLIVFTYESYDKWQSDKSKFLTYLWNRLKGFEVDVITRATGIKTTRYQMNKYKEENGRPLVINLTGFMDDNYGAFDDCEE